MGLKLLQKFVGSFEVYLMCFLGCSKETLDSSFFPNFDKTKVTPLVSKTSGGGSRPLLENVHI